MAGKDHPGNEMSGYSGNFDGAPVTLADDDDDADEEEIGTHK